MTELLPQIKELDVDEVFAKYLVSQIQSIHRQYASSAAKSKTELHTLVGERYRDLIRIAEDIDSMNTLSAQIDYRLSEIAYKAAGNVHFGASAAARFDSMARRRRADTARQASQKTVFNNIINNKIIAFDLKIQSDAIQHSLTLVDMAKMYHTLSSTFRRSLEDGPWATANYDLLKGNFIDFLQKRIEGYFPHASGKSFADLLFLSLYGETDEIDLLTESLDVDDETVDESVPWSTLSLSMTSLSVESLSIPSSQLYFARQAKPIVNFLLAYIIVNHDNEQMNTLEKIAQRIISLRLAYLRRKVQEGGGKSVNFFTALKFIESTSSIITEHFSTLGTGQIHTFLRKLDSWNPSDVLGFHNWLDLDLVRFQGTRYVPVSEEFLSSMKKDLVPFFEHVLEYSVRSFSGQELEEKLPKSEKLSTEDKLPKDDELSKSERLLNMVSSLACSLRKVQVISSINGENCVTVELVSSQDFLNTFCETALKLTGSAILSHQDFVTEELTKSLDVLPLIEKQQDLFTPELVSLVDSSVEDYLMSIMSTGLGSQLNSSIHSELEAWFRCQSQLIQRLSPKYSVIENLTKTLTRKYMDVEDFTLYGSFSIDSFMLSLSSLKSSLNDSLIEKCSRVLVKISTLLEKTISGADEERLFHFLNLIRIFRAHLEPLEGASDLIGHIDMDARRVFECIFNHLLDLDSGLDGTIGDVLRDPRTLTDALEMGMLPRSAHIRVLSMMQKMSCTILSSSIFTENQVFEMCLDNGFKRLFIEVKNEWILSVVIPEVLKSLGGEKDDAIGGQEFQGEEIQKDEIQKDEIQKDEIQKDEIQKDEIQKDEIQKDEIKKNKDDEAQIVEEGLEKTESETQNKSDSVRSKAKDKQSIPANEKIRQLFANIAFLVSFTCVGQLNPNDQNLNQTCHHIEKAAGVQLDRSTIELIVHGVYEGYTSGREMFTPLLMN